MEHGGHTNGKTAMVSDPHPEISVGENSLQRGFAPDRFWSLSSVWGYGLATAATALGAMIRWSLPGELAGAPYLAFYPAVVVAAAFGGLGPGLLATIGSALCVDLLFDTTPGWIDVTNLAAIGRLLIFLIGGSGVSLIAQKQRNTRVREHRQAEALLKAHDELERRVEERTRELQAANVSLQTEITERKQIAEALRQTSLYARSLIEASLDPLVTISPEGKITDVDKATEMVTGVSRDHLIGSDFSDYFTEPGKAREGYRKVLAEGQVRDYPLTIRHASGRTTEVLYNATVYRNEAGQVQGVFAAARDVTDRKRMEGELRRASLYARSLIEASLDPLVTISPEGKVTDVNEATERVTGVSRGRLVGSDFSDYFTEPEKAREGYQKVIAEGLVRDYPLTIRHVSGRTTDVLYNAALYRDEAGNVQGVFAAARDITERKRAELEKDRLAAELLQKNQEMEQIIYVTSHDLRSPLVNVQGFGKELGSSLKELTILLNDYAFPSEQRTKLTFLLEKDIPESLHFINSSVLKMDSLLAGLLKLSRLGRVELKEERIDMNQFLAEVVRGFEFQFKERGVAIEISDLPPCTGDKLQINQVFSNLLDNALKYLDPGRPGRIRISGRMAAGDPEYCVEDNGIGIAPEHQEKAFEIFHRLNPAMGKGEGLGLTIVRRILERHHGTVRIESEPGKGCRFYVSLPKG